MNKNKNIVLFVNDSYFSFLLARSIIESNHKRIALIVFSKSIVSSWRKVFNIFKKVTIKYFLYRSFIQIMSAFIFKSRTVEFLANKYKIKKVYVNNSNSIKEKIDSNCVGFLFNFDIIIKKEVLSKFEQGIYNIHASKLPKDKGISPVLWAFARGDLEIWSSIYKVDEGIDSGPLVKQLKILTLSNDTAFSLYSRVCVKSGEALNDILNDILNDKIVFLNQSLDIESNYLSWPNENFLFMMKKSNRKLISIKSFLKNI